MERGTLRFYQPLRGINENVKVNALSSKIQSHHKETAVPQSTVTSPTDVLNT